MSKILVVDDEFINREILLELLGDQHEIIEAETGEACLAVLEEWLPDLILLDVRMPGIDGFQTCHCIKQSTDHQHIPVVLLSALSLSEIKESGQQAGATDYICKPFNLDEVEALVARLVT